MDKVFFLKDHFEKKKRILVFFLLETKRRSMGLLDFRGEERFSSYHRKGLFSRVFYCAITVQL